MLRLAALTTLALAHHAHAQSSAYGQCGGIGWAGSTSCVSGYTCTISSAYYSQCIPGTAPTTSKSPVTTSNTGSSTSSPVIISTPTTSSGPTGTVAWAPGTATLLPNQLWIRADEQPDFHFYLQSKVLNSPGDAVISNPATAAQNNIVSGQLVQYLPSGSKLYLGVYPNATGTTRLKMYWSTAPATNVTWSWEGDGVQGNVPGYTSAATGNFLSCTDTSTTATNIYLDLGAFDYLTPTGCASETLNYYNGATTVT
ncbi:carbohydrate-binding module family 1 protein [Athelia psychrophila]|uniref:Carbohydrate-binding module family 1 protein n=1 Tax=Athelia psychrophila TaxID=1759441 RepID=A0A166BM03_9AGAM|nr:carbohydrate-binding module family 1 protein [Fibularhizoctonia sp. CBS 109695]